MNSLPTGTVTFLFTDIEGSTKLWQEFPNAMPAALARHHEILRAVIEEGDGYVFQIIGDAFCAAFATALGGLDAALRAQRGLRDETWGETGAIRVRMALHTGAARVRTGEFTSGEYVSGYTLSRAARLLSAGHGGQILLSEPTAALVREHLPPDISLRDMGAHRLKDLVQPQQIFQVLAPELPHDFAALKTMDALPNNLPVQLTSFVGREHEIIQVRDLIHRARLLTLTGAGGSGKTRLSVQVAAEIIDEFEKGAWFVGLAPISEPSLVPDAVLKALELREEVGRAPLDMITDFLHAKKLLLILDNCEHVIEACAQLAHRLLTRCPNLKILATSREALGAAGEVTYPVPVLGLPDMKQKFSPETLTQYDAVKLFIERAFAIQPNFAVTNANAPAVAQICYRLDGIPLAIELAAARIKMFSPEQLAARLDERLRVLTGGSRTATPRQQTLRGTIDWSYSLLSEQERVLFRRLAVFVGGWAFEAAEQVCTADDIDTFDILELLAHLVDKSLVVTELRGQETRYRMLETIREYAHEKLREASETELLRDKHLDYFVEYTEQAEPHLKRAEQLEWLVRLDAELDNLRAAVEWAIRVSNFERGARLVNSLEYFWILREIAVEAYSWIEKLLVLSNPSERTQLRARILRLASSWGEPGTKAKEQRLQRADEALAIFRELRNATWIAQGLDCLAQRYDDTNSVLPLRQERLVIARDLNDEWILADALNDLGRLAILQSNNEGARDLLEESLSTARRVGDRILLGAVLNNLQFLLTDRGEYAQGIRLLLEERGYYEQLGFRNGAANATQTLGMIANNFGDYSNALLYSQEAINRFEELGSGASPHGIVSSFATLGMAELHAYHNVARSIEHIEKSYAMAVSNQRKMPLYTTHSIKGHLALHIGDLHSAAAHGREALLLSLQLSNKQGVLVQVCELGLVSSEKSIREIDSKSAARAVCLFGAAQAGFERFNLAIFKWLQVERDDSLPILREVMGESEFNDAWAEGRALTLEQAIELALTNE